MIFVLFMQPYLLAFKGILLFFLLKIIFTYFVCVCLHVCMCAHTCQGKGVEVIGQHIGSWCFLGLGYQIQSIMADGKLLYLLNHLVNLVLLLNACI